MGATHCCSTVRSGPHLEHQPAGSPVPVVLRGGVSRAVVQRVGQGEAVALRSSIF